jgi:hypothetical protein
MYESIGRCLLFIVSSEAIFARSIIQLPSHSLSSVIWPEKCILLKALFVNFVAIVIIYVSKTKDSAYITLNSGRKDATMTG